MQTLTRALWLALAVYLAGCTTHVSNVRKDQSYKQRLTETAIIWLTPPENFGVSILRTSPNGPAGISEEDKQDAQKGAADLVALFQQHSQEIIGKSLASSNIQVSPQAQFAPTHITLRATSGYTECAPLGCQHSIWIQASVYDKASAKVVWSASIRVGAVFPMKNDISVVQDFSKSLVSELRASKLI